MSGGLLADNSHLGLQPILEQSGLHPLEPWQLEFCKWLAAHSRAKAKDQEQMASYLAGTTITWQAIRQMRGLKNFRNWYARYRAKIMQRIDDAREAFETTNVPKAIDAHAKAIDLALDANDFKAVASLAAPAIKALYRHMEETTEKPLIVLTLGGGGADLDQPPIDVEYEELPAELHDDSAS